MLTNRRLTPNYISAEFGVSKLSSHNRGKDKSQPGNKVIIIIFIKQTRFWKFLILLIVTIYYIFLQQPDLSPIPDLTKKEKKLEGYFKISRHYKWALGQVFDTMKYKTVIIMEGRFSQFI